MLRLVLSALLLLVTPSKIGQAETRHDFRLWTNVTAVTDLGHLSSRLTRWRLWTEVQNRFRDLAKDEDLDQLLVRSGLGYELAKDLSVWLGYGYIPVFAEAGKVVNEHRLWQQLLWSSEFDRFSFTSRSRLEQRFIEGAGVTAWRYRQFVRLAHPLARPLPLSLVLWDEAFVHLNSASPTIQTGLDQNRIFAGLGWQVTQPARIEIGYLNQFIDTPSLNRIHHIFSLNLFLNL